ncbi:MAG: hypothetical protein A2020_03780 [Lentisphaerae bacterium GWF2_45_14]|nr:MAG: hypothetical protein A2020_03780 [Lentisphaerae bacterium GWF2_45_14]
MSSAKEYWDAAAGVKEFTIPFDVALFSRFVPSLDSTILDIGCGYGRILRELDAEGYKNLSGTDISPKMLELARNDFPNASLKVIDNETLPFESDSFDALVMLAVLTCIITDVEQERLMSEAKRVLRPGGIIYLCDFLLNTDERNIERYERHHAEFGTYGTFRAEGGGGLRHHTEEWINKLCSDFEKLHFEKNIFRTMNGHTSNGFSSIYRSPGR